MRVNQLLMRLFRQYPHWMILSVLLGFSGAVFNGISITLIIPLILEFMGQNVIKSGGFPPALRPIFSSFDSIPEQYRTLVMIACVVVMILLKNLATYSNSITSGIMGRSFASSLRREGFQLLLEVDLSYYSNVRLGDLMNYINTEVNRTTSAIRTLTRIAIALITILVFLGILLAISWHLTLIATVLLGIVALANQLSIRKAKAFGKELSRVAGALSSRAIEVLSGIRLVKATTNEDREYTEIDKLITQREAAEFESQLVFASIGPVNEMLSILALLGLIVMGRLLFSDQLQAFSSIILTYLLVLFRTLPFIGQLNSARSQLANTSPSVEILTDFLNRSDKPFMQSGQASFNGLQTEIRFKDIFFKYPNSDDWILKGINLTLPKGQTLALVGSSGAGKSTLADLLPRFYDPVEGSIEIDGKDLRTFDIKQFRHQVGVVSQDTFLFNASVKENISYSRPSATDEEVIKAAKRANAYEFIVNLPEGFDTIIGDRGVLLSGGQRQRLAIARALLQDPEILILDEATSALDTISEKLVQQALDDLSHNRTTLVIAHRLSTIHKADQIAVLDKGRVIELGRHQELLQAGNHYAYLYSMQFAESIPSNGLALGLTNKENQIFCHVSYEMRSQLSRLLGVLRLLIDDMIDNPAEHEELTGKAYQSALNMLQSLEEFECTISNNVSNNGQVDIQVSTKVHPN
jgi:subfamily B ATP-binding cassette protein MsbA